MNNFFEHEVNIGFLNSFYRRQAVSSDIKVFNVEEFGISKKQMIEELSGSFMMLPFDYYDVGFKIEKLIKDYSIKIFNDNEESWNKLWGSIGRKKADLLAMNTFWEDVIDDELVLTKINKIVPHRKRSCYGYIATKSTKDKNTWIVKENGVPNYKQKVNDSRSKPRNWAAPESRIIRNENVLKLIAIFSEVLNTNVAVKSNSFAFTFHQMLTYAIAKGYNEPAPEGVHSDGVDFIVSALVIERNNITGGESSVYYRHSKDKKLTALKHTLQPGEGIFQADDFNNYKHGISSISNTKKDTIGYRSIIGFDIEILN